MRWTKPAVNDLTAICDFIEQKSGTQTANRVATAIHDGVANLNRFPYSGRSGRVPETREIVFPGLPYLAIYRLRGDAIELIRIARSTEVALSKRRFLN